MSFSAQEADSNRLLTRLLESVQECQKRFGGKTELATEFEPCVLFLCGTIEAVYLHGLRNRPLEKPQQTSTLKQVSELVQSSLNLNSEHASFWPFVSKHLTSHERDRYNALKQIWTDTGRGRAWIRSTLNERSLEKYFNRILNDRNQLKTYYEDWAFVCDDEKNSLLPNMAAGLASILFAVSIDKPELNSCAYSKKIERPKIEPIIQAPIEKPKEVKKRRKVAKQMISFDDDDLDTESASSVGSSEPYRTFLKLNSKEMEEVNEINSSDSSTSSRSAMSENEKPVRKLSVENSGSREKYPTSVKSLTTLDKVIGELTPISVETSETGGDEAIETPTDVSAVLSVIESKNREELDKLNDKISLLSKENENLREQVEKYFSAVQLLEKGESEVDYKTEAELFETKLVQVAEMHAELMDFNAVLQKNLCLKDAHIEKLKLEIDSLSGTETEVQTSVQVWIPSAFLTGSGSDAHHVYQIYIRAGTDEWNIYRRYAQFHALHSDLKKLDSNISHFDFPPKRSLRNKKSSLVEDRRKRLQTYLRKILAHWPELSQCNGRYLLEQHLAFFKEDSKTTFPTSRRTGPAPTSSDNHYTGL